MSASATLKKRVEIYHSVGISSLVIRPLFSMLVLPSYCPNTSVLQRGTQMFIYIWRKDFFPGKLCFSYFIALILSHCIHSHWDMIYCLAQPQITADHWIDCTFLFVRQQSLFSTKILMHKIVCTPVSIYPFFCSCISFWHDKASSVSQLRSVLCIVSLLKT